MKGLSEVETPSENVRLDRVCSSNLLLDRGMKFCYGAGVSTCTRSHRQSQNFRDLSERELTVDFQMNNLMLLLEKLVPRRIAPIRNAQDLIHRTSKRIHCRVAAAPFALIYLSASDSFRYESP